MTGLVYLILGCATSGRRQVLYDLVQDMATDECPFTVIRCKSESPNEWDEKLDNRANVTVELYNADVESISSDQLNPHHTNIILSPGLANPVDQIEALKPLLDSTDCQLARIITIAHCALLESHKHFQNWYDACIHFSDVCLINRGPNTTNQFVQDFIDRYKDNHFPCLLEATKKGRVTNPSLILEPEARRISLFFEPEEDRWLDDEDEDEEEPSEDPYLIKLPSGNREKWVPDIKTLL